MGDRYWTNCKPRAVAEVHFFIYSHLAKKVGKSIADKTAILYGGSVKPTNATEILSIDYVNGLLVGGASLIAEDFFAIINCANLIDA